MEIPRLETKLNLHLVGTLPRRRSTLIDSLPKTFVKFVATAAHRGLLSVFIDAKLIT